MFGYILLLIVKVYLHSISSESVKLTLCKVYIGAQYSSSSITVPIKYVYKTTAIHNCCYFISQ